MLAENWAFADFSSSRNSKTSLLLPNLIGPDVAKIGTMADHHV